MSAPTLADIRQELLNLALRVEELRQAERTGSTADAMELFALDLGRNYERIEGELLFLKRMEAVRE